MCECERDIVNLKDRKMEKESAHTRERGQKDRKRDRGVDKRMERDSDRKREPE